MAVKCISIDFNMVGKLEIVIYYLLLQIFLQKFYKVFLEKSSSNQEDLDQNTDFD